MLPGRKAVALGAGLGAALLLLAAAYHARDILVAYHAGVLRRDPRLMAEWSRAPADSLRAEALREFLRTPAGIKALRQRIFASVIDLAVKEDIRFGPSTLAAGRFIQFGLFHLGSSRYLVADGPRTCALPLAVGSEILALEPWFESLGTGDFDLAEHPGISFTVRTYREDSGRGPLVVEGSLTRLTEKHP